MRDVEGLLSRVRGGDIVYHSFSRAPLPNVPFEAENAVQAAFSGEIVGEAPAAAETPLPSRNIPAMRAPEPERSATQAVAQGWKVEPQTLARSAMHAAVAAAQTAHAAAATPRPLPPIFETAPVAAPSTSSAPLSLRRYAPAAPTLDPALPLPELWARLSKPR
jgi:hypothetical protein